MQSGQLHFCVHVTWVLALIVASVFACEGGLALGQTSAQAEKRIEFPSKDAIRNSELVVKAPATVLIGEIHGTAEVPPLVASLVRSGLQSNAPTILCVEMSSSQQASLDQFLHSDGGDAAVAVMLATPHWFNLDGRASVGMLEMIELMRQLSKQGQQVRVLAIDTDWELPSGLESISPEELERIKMRMKKLAGARDKTMADAVIVARKKFPKSNIIVLAGNVHTNLNKGAPWDPKYIPMGWYLAQEIPQLRSLNVQFSGGKAWVMNEKGPGPSAFPGTDRGQDPFIELFKKPKNGRHGVLYVGKITAAKPAVSRNTALNAFAEKLLDFARPKKSPAKPKGD